MYSSIFIVQIYYTTTTTVLQLSGFWPGLPGWSGTRKVKPVWIYWSKR